MIKLCMVLVISVFSIFSVLADDFFGRYKQGSSGIDMCGITLGAFSDKETTAREGDIFLGMSRNEIPIEVYGSLLACGIDKANNGTGGLGWAFGVESDFGFPLEPVIGTELLLVTKDFNNGGVGILTYLGLKSNLFWGQFVLTSAIGYMTLMGPGHFKDYEDDNKYQTITESQFCIIFRICYSGTNLLKLN